MVSHSQIWVRVVRFSFEHRDLHMIQRNTRVIVTCASTHVCENNTATSNMGVHRSPGPMTKWVFLLLFVYNFTYAQAQTLWDVNGNRSQDYVNLVLFFELCY